MIWYPKHVEPSDTIAEACELFLCSAVASVVSQFRCEGPNRTEAMLLLTWDNPPGSNLGFQIQIDGSKHEIQRCNPCSYNISRLSYDTQYTVAIATKACGSSSTLTSITCKTGITGVYLCLSYNFIIFLIMH